MEKGGKNETCLHVMIGIEKRTTTVTVQLWCSSASKCECECGEESTKRKKIHAHSKVRNWSWTGRGSKREHEEIELIACILRNVREFWFSVFHRPAIEDSNAILALCDADGGFDRCNAIIMKQIIIVYRPIRHKVVRSNIRLFHSLVDNVRCQWQCILIH